MACVLGGDADELTDATAEFEGIKIAGNDNGKGWMQGLDMGAKLCDALIAGSGAFMVQVQIVNNTAVCTTNVAEAGPGADAGLVVAITC
jgi:hypothetical protein